MTKIEDHQLETPLRGFGRHDEYRNTGVEWLGDIPAHWRLYRVSEVAQVINGYPFDSEYFTLDEGVPLVRIRDLYSNRTEINYSGPVVENAWIERGDVLVGMDGEFNVARWKGGRALLNQRMCCVRSKSQVDAPLIAYALPLPLRVVNALTYSTTVKHLAASDVRKTLIAMPPSEAERRSIVYFLDRETAKIDALVARKEAMIAALQEKRIAAITQTITHGLDLDAPTRDSGSDTLGRIPADWEATPLWRLTPRDRQIMYGIVLPGPSVDDGVPIVKGGDVAPQRLRLDRLSRTTREIDAAHARSRLREGDIVYAIRGSIGEVAMIPSEVAGANLTQDAARVAYGPATHGPWLLYALRSRAVFAQLEAGALGATIRGINIRDLKRAVIPVPPREEQKAIAAALDEGTKQIDQLVAKVTEAIERLSELRTALISAAVTGKIDVRGEAA